MRFLVVIAVLLGLFLISVTMNVEGTRNSSRAYLVKWQPEIIRVLEQNDWSLATKIVENHLSGRFSNFSIYYHNEKIASVPIVETNASCIFPFEFKIDHYGVPIGDVRACDGLKSVVWRVLKSPSFWASCLFVLVLMVAGIIASMASYRRTALNFLKRMEDVKRQDHEGMPPAVNTRDPLMGKLEELLNGIIGLEKEKQNLTMKYRITEMYGRLASQVSHDIRSPLAALQAMENDLALLPEDTRVLVRSAVNRIRDIANSLLEKSGSLRNLESSVPEAASIELISGAVDYLVSEKRIQYRAKTGVEIELHATDTSYGLFAWVQLNQFKRALSNLVNNAVEALPGKGHVRIRIFSTDVEMGISVEDDGCGMSPELLKDIGKPGKTYGKPGGSGLGLYHARSVVESWGGRIEIQSEVGKGTVVTVFLPKAEVPAWFVPELILVPGSAIVVVDDDLSIHHIWQGRLESMKTGGGLVRVVHFSTFEELQQWLRKCADKARGALFLMDYEFIGHEKNGLDVIQEMGLARQSILVTNWFEEKDVVDRCIWLGVRMIPKGMASLVPIRLKRARGTGRAESQMKCLRSLKKRGDLQASPAIGCN